jgi:hypothetical protein
MIFICYYFVFNIWYYTALIYYKYYTSVLIRQFSCFFVGILRQYATRQFWDFTTLCSYILFFLYIIYILNILCYICIYILCLYIIYCVVFILYILYVIICIYIYICKVDAQVWKAVFIMAGKTCTSLYNIYIIHIYIHAYLRTYIYYIWYIYI